MSTAAEPTPGSTDTTVPHGPSSHGQGQRGRGAYREPADQARDQPGNPSGGHRGPGLHPSQTLARQKEQFGGVKIGSAFFGWLTATGTAVLLTALLTAAGTVLTLATGTSANTLTKGITHNPTTISIAGAIAVAVILLVAYYCGGYVAGRMARFNGIKQGIAVWVWTIVIAVVIAIVAAIAGSKYDVLSQLNAFPRIPVGQGHLTSTAIASLVISLLVALIGAVLGGLAGMHFHRKVDRLATDLTR